MSISELNNVCAFVCYAFACACACICVECVYMNVCVHLSMCFFHSHGSRLQRVRGQWLVLGNDWGFKKSIRRGQCDDKLTLYCKVNGTLGLRCVHYFFAPCVCTHISHPYTHTHYHTCTHTHSTHISLHVHTMPTNTCTHTRHMQIQTYT